MFLHLQFLEITIDGKKKIKQTQTHKKNGAPPAPHYSKHVFLSKIYVWFSRQYTINLWNNTTE